MWRGRRTAKSDLSTVINRLVSGEWGRKPFRNSLLFSTAPAWPRMPLDGPPAFAIRFSWRSLHFRRFGILLNRTTI